MKLPVPCTQAFPDSLQPKEWGLWLDPVNANGWDVGAIAVRADAARCKHPISDSSRILLLARLAPMDQSTQLHDFYCLVCTYLLIAAGERGFVSPLPGSAGQ